jgi:hypothetical protein
LHQVTWLYDQDKINAIVANKNPDLALKNYDYFYLELRNNREYLHNNHPDIVRFYRKSPLVTEVAHFESPEKRVYIMKVNHDYINSLSARRATGAR